MACRPPEPSPENLPHWKVNCLELAPAPAKDTAGLTAVLSPAVATTTTEATRPVATSCVEATPSPTLVVASVGLSDTPGTSDCSLKLIVVPACGVPRLSIARKRRVVISPSLGLAGD